MRLFQGHGGSSSSSAPHHGGHSSQASWQYDQHQAYHPPHPSYSASGFPESLPEHRPWHGSDHDHTMQYVPAFTDLTLENATDQEGQVAPRVVADPISRNSNYDYKFQFPAGIRWTPIHNFADRIIRLKGKQYGSYTAHHNEMMRYVTALTREEEKIILEGDEKKVRSLARRMALQKRPEKSVDKKGALARSFGERVLVLREKTYSSRSGRCNEVRRIILALTPDETDVIQENDADKVESLAREVAYRRHQKAVPWTYTTPEDTVTKLKLLILAMYGEKSKYQERILKKLGEEDRSTTAALLDTGDVISAAHMIGAHSPKLWATRLKEGDIRDIVNTYHELQRQEEERMRKGAQSHGQESNANDEEYHAWASLLDWQREAIEGAINAGDEHTATALFQQFQSGGSAH
ncbi:hypothetical protein CBS101457_004928 [Exobasidium rhododendri]|nr:hypothetical protein CBS101457_004928 [Exobasidium rhododendri]